METEYTVEDFESASHTECACGCSQFWLAWKGTYNFSRCVNCGKVERIV